MVMVLGPKGGAGKTLVSSSLAVTLAEAGKRVVLVDLDLQFGDVGLALGPAARKTIYDLVDVGRVAGRGEARATTSSRTSRERGCFRRPRGPTRPRR